MGEVCLREFQLENDYAAATRLWGEAGPGIHMGKSDTPEEIRKKLLRDPDLFLVAELDGILIGTVMGGFDGRRGLIYHLAVDPAYRTQGIGSRLMDEVERRLIAKGCIRCYLVVTSENTQAMQYYEKRGWKVIPNYLYGKDLV